MTPEELRELFKKHDDEYLKFERIERKPADFLTHRPDLYAFLILDTLVRSERHIVSAAEHDEIFIDVTPEKLAEAGVTEAQVIDLIRCGLIYPDEYDCFAMFV